MVGLLFTGLLPEEDRNYFFLPLGSTDTLLRKFDSSYVIFYEFIECEVKFYTNFFYLF